VCEDTKTATNEQDISSLLEYFAASAVRFRALAQKPQTSKIYQACLNILRRVQSVLGFGSKLGQ
jgi:hypothetical protein